MTPTVNLADPITTRNLRLDAIWLQPACRERRVQPRVNRHHSQPHSRRFRTTSEVAWPARYSDFYTARVPQEAYTRSRLGSSCLNAPLNIGFEIYGFGFPFFWLPFVFSLAALLGPLLFLQSLKYWF